MIQTLHFIKVGKSCVWVVGGGGGGWVEAYVFVVQFVGVYLFIYFQKTTMCMEDQITTTKKEHLALEK